MNPLPTISIVTPSFQHAEFIDQTIRSVLDQRYPHLDYWVIDGGSTDGTLDILDHYRGQLQWISERDAGQADAINKGFRRATGEIFGWLNSDDYYAPGALHRVGQYFAANPQAQFVYGNVIGIDRRGREYGVRLHVGRRQAIAAADAEILVNQYDFLVQPACFWRASLWRELGELDTALRYTMDYEWWMRAARHTRLYYLPEVLAYERLYGAAKTGSGDIPRMLEMELVARRHGGSGLPANYRGEAAAHFVMRALKRTLRRQPGAAADWRAARAYGASPLRVLRYLAVMLLFGQQAVPAAWLWLNRVRNLGKKG